MIEGVVGRGRFIYSSSDWLLGRIGGKILCSRWCRKQNVRLDAENVVGSFVAVSAPLSRIMNETLGIIAVSRAFTFNIN